MGYWTGRRVAVTGGDGFIGSHLVERLLREGAKLRVLVEYNSQGRLSWLDPIRDDLDLVFGDIRDGARVTHFAEGQEVVFHLAALIGIPYSYLAPESYVQVNVIGIQNILNACRQAKVARLVHTSTSEVYGSAVRIPIDETHPYQPQSPYSASKIAADMLALSWWHSFGIPVAVVRPFNTYGPRQSARAIIPTVLSQVHSGRAELKLGSVAPTRDFNFVTDTVAGFLAVAACERAVGQVVNVGSGREISVQKLVALILDITGSQARLVVDEQRLRPKESEVMQLLCDNTRAREWTGWRPAVPLEEGLRLTSDWVKSSLSLLREGTVYHV